MAKDSKVKMPSSMGGLTRYSDEEKSKLEFSPGQIVVICLIIIIAIVTLSFFGAGWLGIGG